ncbi:MAG: hypothetical protein V3V25_00195 [Paracoccaceae bacterium]
MKTTKISNNIVKSLTVVALAANMSFGATQAQAGEREIAQILAAIAAAAIAAKIGNNQASSGNTQTAQPIQVSNNRTALPSSLQTADSDSIRVVGSPGSGSGPTLLCLKTTSGMWAKALNFSNGAVLNSEGGTRACTNVAAGNVQFDFIKAKFAGVMTYVGSSSMNLTGWEGGTVTINWMAD